MTDSMELQNFAIWGQTLDLEEEEDILDFLLKHRDLDVPDEFDNAIRNIDEDDVIGSTIIFSDSFPANPSNALIEQGSINMILISVNEDRVRTIFDVDPEFLETSMNALDRILEDTRLHIADLDLDYQIDVPFSELRLDIEGPDFLEYQGVRFVDDEFNYIVQSTSSPEVSTKWPEMNESGEMGDESSEITKADVTNIDHFDLEENSDDLDAMVQRVEGTLAELMP